MSVLPVGLQSSVEPLVQAALADVAESIQILSTSTDAGIIKRIEFGMTVSPLLWIGICACPPPDPHQERNQNGT